jgi:hypothetical protein
MQDSVCCDYFRTPVKFKGPDIYRIVGEYQNKVKQKISISFWQHFPCTDSGRFFSSLIEPVSTIAVPDIQSSA